MFITHYNCCCIVKILFKKRDHGKKISYVRRAYESVDDESLYISGYISKFDAKMTSGSNGLSSRYFLIFYWWQKQEFQQYFFQTVKINFPIKECMIIKIFILCIVSWCTLSEPSFRLFSLKGSNEHHGLEYPYFECIFRMNTGIYYDHIHICMHIYIHSYKYIYTFIYMFCIYIYKKKNFCVHI